MWGRVEQSFFGGHGVGGGGVGAEEAAAEGFHVFGSVAFGAVDAVASCYLQSHHEFGVEVFQDMHGDGLWSSGGFGGAEFVFAVVREDDVLEDVDEGLGNLFAEDLLGGAALVFDPDGGLDDVADELAGIGVAERAVVGELPRFGDVVEEDAGDDQIAVEAGVETANAVGDFD